MYAGVWHPGHIRNLDAGKWHWPSRLSVTNKLNSSEIKCPHL